MTLIKYSQMFDFWLRNFGATVIEQSNYIEFISFHSWRDRDDFLSIGTKSTISTVAIWTVKKKQV